MRNPSRVQRTLNMLYSVPFILQNNLRAEDHDPNLDDDPHITRIFVDMECSVYTVPVEKALMCLDANDSEVKEEEMELPSHMNGRERVTAPLVDDPRVKRMSTYLSCGMDDSDIALERALMNLDLGDDLESSDSEAEQEEEIELLLHRNGGLGSRVPAPMLERSEEQGVSTLTKERATLACGAGLLQHSWLEDSASLSSFSTK